MPLQFSEALRDLGEEEKKLWREWVDKVRKPIKWTMGYMVCFLCISNTRIKHIRGEQPFWALLRKWAKGTPREEMTLTIIEYAGKDEGETNPLFFALTQGMDDEAVNIIADSTDKDGFNHKVIHTAPNHLQVGSLLGVALLSNFAKAETILRILRNTTRWELVDAVDRMLTEHLATHLDLEDEAGVRRAISKRVKTLKPRNSFTFKKKLAAVACSVRQAVSPTTPRASALSENLLSGDAHPF